jgi:hypothetical protein
MEHVINMIVQAAMSAAITLLGMFVILRLVIPQIGEEISEGISSLTHLGAKVAGARSGESRKRKAIVNDMAQGFLNSPKMTGLKLIGKQLGFDLDAMVEEHGAAETMQGLSQLAGMVGIDITQFVSGNIGLSAQKPSQLGLKA